MMSPVTGWILDIHTTETQENTSSCNTYIHPDSDLHHKPPIKSKAELKEMYQYYFSGVGKFKNFECHINIDKNVRTVVHAPCMIALSLQNKVEKELEMVR